MQKLSSTLDAASYYDDELGELYHQHDVLQNRCHKLLTQHLLRLSEQTQAVDAPLPVAPTASSGRFTIAPPVAVPPASPWSAGSEQSSEEDFDSGVDGRRDLRELVQSLTQVPTIGGDAPLLARAVEEEINAVAASCFDLVSSRKRLYDFFQRRRSSLSLQCSMLGCRLRRFARSWQVAQRVAPPFYVRLRALEQDIEAVEQRLRRLRPATGAKEPRPIGQACTGKELFFTSEPFEESTLSCVYRSDVVACIQYEMTEDKMTRGLRRYLQQMQHLPVTHREEIWQRTLAMEAVTREAPLPLILTPDKPAFRHRLRELAALLGCGGDLRTDHGHAFVRQVATDFPVIFGTECRALQFPDYPPSVKASGGLTEGGDAGIWANDGDEDPGPPRPYLKSGTWPSLVMLQAKVDLAVMEQRLLMSVEGGVVSPPPSPRLRVPGAPAAPPPAPEFVDDRAMHEAMEFLKERDDKVVMEKLCQLSEERTDTDAAEELGMNEEINAQAPEQMLRAYYLLRHLRVQARH